MVGGEQSATDQVSENRDQLLTSDTDQAWHFSAHVTADQVEVVPGGVEALQASQEVIMVHWRLLCLCDVKPVWEWMNELTNIERFTCFKNHKHKTSW